VNELGLVGGLGKELLAALMAATEYRAVHIGVTQAIASAAPKFRPWLFRRGVVLADDAFFRPRYPTAPKAASRR